MKLAALAILILAASAFTQTDLPDRGSLDEIKDKTKFYVIADGLQTKYILEQLKKNKALVLVNKSDDAEFFIEYRILKEAPPASGIAAMLSTQGQMDVFYRRGEKRVIVWTDVDVGGLPSRSLTKKFAKDFGQLNKLK